MRYPFKDSFLILLIFPFSFYFLQAQSLEWLEITQSQKNHLIDDLVENNIHQTKIDFNKPFRISVPVVDDSISILICIYTDPDFFNFVQSKCFSGNNIGKGL